MPLLWPFGDASTSASTSASAASYTPLSSSLSAASTTTTKSTILYTLIRRASKIDPTKDQKILIGVIAIYSVVILILWNVPILKWSIYPFKLLVVGMHEFSHAIVGLLTGASIKSISLDPNEGGATTMVGGISWLTLPAGYLGSSLIGAIMIACGFDVVASKIMTLVLAAVFLLTLWWARRDWLVWILLLGMAGIIVAFWFIAHGVALQFLVLFLGTMSCLYSIWDICEDLIFRKVAESDASAFSRLVGGPPQLHGFIWSIISLGFMAAGIIVGIVAFKESLSQQADSTFLVPRSVASGMGMGRDDFVVLVPR